jgi:hypothetical protein
LLRLSHAQERIEISNGFVHTQVTPSDHSALRYRPSKLATSLPFAGLSTAFFPPLKAFRPTQELHPLQPEPVPLPFHDAPDRAEEGLDLLVGRAQVLGASPMTLQRRSSEKDGRGRFGEKEGLESENRKESGEGEGKQERRLTLV